MAKSSSIVERAIEAAASYLIKKVDNRHQKHSKRHQCPKQGINGYLRLPSKCECEKEKLQIEEGKTSSVMRSHNAERISRRRNGVAETCEMDRKLVRETLEVILKTNGMAAYNFRAEF